MAAFEERRQTPRVRPQAPCALSLTVGATARVVDLSETGVLLISPVAFPVTARGRFRALFGSQPFEADVEIRRRQALTEAKATRHGHALGVMFASLGPEARQVLKTLSRSAKSSEGS